MTSEVLELIVRDDDSTSSSTTYNLSDGTICAFTDFRGRGIPKSVWGIEGLPSAFGGRFQTFNLEPRKITVDFLWKVDTETEAETRRNLIYKIFKPFFSEWYTDSTTAKMSLRLTLASGEERQIDCQTEGLIDMPYSVSDAESASGIAGKFRVSFICPDPIWYDPTPVTIASGGSTADLTDTSWFMYPTFTLVGPITYVQFTGPRSKTFRINSVPSGRTFTVTTDPNNRTVINDLGEYQFATIDEPIDFHQYNLEPSWFTGSTSYGHTKVLVGAGSSTTSIIKRYIGV